MRKFYEISVQDGFQGTFEEFSRQKNFLAYQRAVKLGRFQGTYDAWRYEIAANRNRGTCAYISSLRLTPQAEQFVGITDANHPRILCPVLVNGQAVGKATVCLPQKYKPTSGTLLRMYYDSEKHLLRFQTQDGEPLPEYTGIDLISKAASVGYRPLLVLAHSEGLIPAVPDGYLPSFDWQTNTKNGYWVRANRLINIKRSYAFYRPTISFPSALGSIRFPFRLSEPENFDYLRFFPYIHEDQTFRLWDVERGVDAPLKAKKYLGPWEPQYVKKKYPALFVHARRLGYWKDF